MDVVRTSPSSPNLLDFSEGFVTVDSPANILSSILLSPNPMSAADLRAMHHWSTHSWHSLSIGQPNTQMVLQFTAPELAFENDFLLNGILGVASLDMQRLLPDPTAARKQTAIYRAKAFNSFRHAISKIDPINRSSYEAALLMALLVIILSSQDYVSGDELTIINWISLYQGLGTIMWLGGADSPMILSSTRVAPIFNRELTKIYITPAIPTILMGMMANIDSTDPDYFCVEDYCIALDSLADLFALARQEGLTAALSTRTVAFPSYLKTEFKGFAKEKRPRALVILAWYLSFQILIKDVWWIDGNAKRDIKVIARMLAFKWHKYLEIPLRIADTEDPEEALRLLLG
jgi:hypothetical protein